MPRTGRSESFSEDTFPDALTFPGLVAMEAANALSASINSAITRQLTSERAKQDGLVDFFVSHLFPALNATNIEAVLVSPTRTTHLPLYEYKADWTPRLSAWLCWDLFLDAGMGGIPPVTPYRFRVTMDAASKDKLFSALDSTSASKIEMAAREAGWACWFTPQGFNFCEEFVMTAMELLASAEGDARPLEWCGRPVPAAASAQA